MKVMGSRCYTWGSGMHIQGSNLLVCFACIIPVAVLPHRTGKLGTKDIRSQPIFSGLPRVMLLGVQIAHMWTVLYSKRCVCLFNERSWVTSWSPQMLCFVNNSDKAHQSQLGTAILELPRSHSFQPFFRTKETPVLHCVSIDKFFR